jgi:recombination protein RecA
MAFLPESRTLDKETQETKGSRNMAKKKKADAPLFDRSDKSDEGRQKALAAALEDLTKRFGEGTIMSLGEAAHLTIDVIPSGSLGVDIALGVGGIPRGRITEIYGAESSGKTTLTLHIIREAQRRGGICAFIDMEHALDPQYAERIGVNLDTLYVSQPDTAEQALEIIESLVRSGAVDVVALDSVAALVPRAEIEGEMGDSHVGLQARLMSQALRKMVAAIKQSNVAVIFTNQLREKIGVMFGSPETQPGGRALKFYASVRLDVRRIQGIKVGEDDVGSRTRVKVKKNKVAPPFKECEFDIMFTPEETGISKAGEIVDLAVELGIIEKRGAFFRYNEALLGQGRENTKQYLLEHPALSDELENTVRQHHTLPTLDAAPVEVETVAEVEE